MIIAVEGIDGAGKNTLVNAIKQAVDQPIEVLSFPRYSDSVHAQLAHDALHGRMGDLAESAYAMATLFALDRHGAVDKLAAYVDSSEILILDRYVASNAAYSYARTRDPEVIDWVYELEFGRFGLPTPDLQVLLDTPPEVAAERATRRAQIDRTRAKDAYERDGSLQERTWRAYEELAKRRWASDWVVTSTVTDIIARLA